jgi:uncharacterized membrane protein YeiH
MVLEQLVVQETYFELPRAITLSAFFTFAATGALAGLKRGYDVIGVFVLAVIAAGGGGMIRDGLLISQGPPGLLTDPYYLMMALAATVVTLLFHRLVDRLGKAIAVIDALGLGAYAVHGLQLAMQAGLSLPGVVLSGMITAVGGGVLRDILVREEPLLFKPGQFYALVALGGCLLFLGLVGFGVAAPNHAALATVATTFALRMLAIRFNWRTTALYRPPLPPAPQA